MSRFAKLREPQKKIKPSHFKALRKVRRGRGFRYEPEFLAMLEKWDYTIKQWLIASHAHNCISYYHRHKKKLQAKEKAIRDSDPEGYRTRHKRYEWRCKEVGYKRAFAKRKGREATLFEMEMIWWEMEQNILVKNQKLYREWVKERKREEVAKQAEYAREKDMVGRPMGERVTA